MYTKLLLLLIIIQLINNSFIKGNELKKNGNFTTKLLKNNLSKHESKQSIKKFFKQNDNQNENDNKLKQRVQLDSNKLDNKIVKENIGLSNFGIRVIKAPSLETLKLDGQRLKELNNKINRLNIKNTEFKKDIKLNNQLNKQIKNQQFNQLNNQIKNQPINHINNQIKNQPINHINNQLNNLNKQSTNKNEIINKANYVVKTVLPVFKSINDTQKYLNYQYDHHIDHSNNIYHHNTNLYRPKNLYVKDHHSLVNEKIERTKNNMKLNLINQRSKKLPIGFDEINFDPLKVHLSPYLKNMHRPNKKWGDPKYPSKRLNQIAYNKLQGPDRLAIKKQNEYRKNGYPHLKRFKKLIKSNEKKPKKLKSNKHENDDFRDDHKDSKHFENDDFDKDFFNEKDKNLRNYNPLFGLNNLERLPSIDFRTLAPVYVKNIDYNTFYKLNPYFTLPLPQYTK